MKIAIIGYGKMGKMVEQIARAQGHLIAAIVDPFEKDAPSGIPLSKDIAHAALDTADAAIEFTQPATAVENIIALAQRKIPTVV
jgi:4-hydroxy-tetrahydrodipicolinate reductase